MSDERLETEVIRDNMRLPKWAPPLRVRDGRVWVVESPAYRMGLGAKMNNLTPKEVQYTNYLMREILDGYS